MYCLAVHNCFVYSYNNCCAFLPDYEDGDNDTECSCKKNCPEGEEYSDCPQAICGPITCDETGFPKTICGDKAICEPGCLCKDGKLRNKDGECVSPDQCRE
ncbi:hypothetical protein evm_014661 [Chilo suppressalis]|nr:hypothetical protein evm_014661 [Chilo suppressalis]